MVFRRTGGKSLYFQARTETGYKQLSTGTPNRTLANKIAGMWDALAVDHRAWDLLTPVLAGQRSLGRLYDLWAETRGQVAEMRRRLNDVDLEPLVADWVPVHARSVKNADSTAHALARLRKLLPAGQPRLASTVTPAWLSGRLADYEGKRNTIRAVHSAWSVFFDYCTTVRGLFDVNPMARVPRPALETPPIQFYDLDVVERIVAAQPDAPRRAVMALAYGGALDVSTSLGLTRSLFDPGAHEVRAAGTKAASRDRVCRLEDWAWPVVWEYVRDLLPTAPLFPTLNRWTVSDWHRETVEALGLTPALPLRNARHHWAVMNLRAGVPVAVVQHQLGHGTAKLTLDTYGAFIPTGADRARWGRHVTEQETKRREAR